jgi:hypothetical protein
VDVVAFAVYVGDWAVITVIASVLRGEETVVIGQLELVDDV